MPFIYALQDPNTRHIHYIGATNYPRQRYSKHLSDARRYVTTSSRKDDWLRELLAQHLKPTLVVLEIVTRHNWAMRETFWIKIFRQQGEPLANETDGGKGSYGRKPSDQTRQKLSRASKGRWSGKHHTRQTRQKMTLSAKKVWQSPERRRKHHVIMLGNTRGKRPRTEDEKIKLSQAHARFTPEQVRMIRKAKQDGATYVQLAVQFNVVPNAIWKICTHNSYKWVR